MLPTLYNDDGDGFVVIAHRGASGRYPENTMIAFRGALEMNAGMIELDVQLSADGIPIVFHDEKLENHTDGSGRLQERTLKELRQLDAGSWFAPEYSGQRIPTLEEVLIFAKGKIALNIEIKAEAVTDEIKPGIEQKCLDLVRQYEMENHILFSSFDYRTVRQLKKRAPEIPAALLYEKKHSAGRLPSELVRKYGADAFNCSFRQLNRKRLRNLLSHNIPVFVYTVNSAQKMRRLLAKGVNGIFTDHPDLLREVARNFFQPDRRRRRS